MGGGGGGDSGGHVLPLYISTTFLSEVRHFPILETSVAKRANFIAVSTLTISQEDEFFELQECQSGRLQGRNDLQCCFL